MALKAANLFKEADLINSYKDSQSLFTVIPDIEELEKTFQNCEEALKYADEFTLCHGVNLRITTKTNEGRKDRLFNQFYNDDPNEDDAYSMYEEKPVCKTAIEVVKFLEDDEKMEDCSFEDCDICGKNLCYHEKLDCICCLNTFCSSCVISDHVTVCKNCLNNTKDPLHKKN